MAGSTPPSTAEVVIANWKTASAAASLNWSSAKALGFERSSHASCPLG